MRSELFLLPGRSLASLDWCQPPAEGSGANPDCQGDHGHLDAPDGVSGCHCQAILLREAQWGGLPVAKEIPLDRRQRWGQFTSDGRASVQVRCVLCEWQFNLDTKTGWRLRDAVDFFEIVQTSGRTWDFLFISSLKCSASVTAPPKLSRFFLIQWMHLSAGRGRKLEVASVKTVAKF